MSKTSDGPARGAPLRALRAAARLTQDAMAARLGISRVLYVQIERGQHPSPEPHIARAVALAGLSAREWQRLHALAFLIYTNLNGEPTL